LKPANVMLLRQHDDHDFVKVLDFGLVKFFKGEGEGDPDITNAGTFMGSPHYIAPEQARNQNPDQRCDIYSLGVVLYQMLTGRVPFTAQAPVDIILKHLHEEPVPPKRARPDLDIDPSLQEIVLRCLSKSREARFQSMDELLVALKRVRSQVTGLVSQSSMPPLGWADSSPSMNAMLPGQTPSSAMRTPSQPMSSMPTPGSGSHHLSRPPPPPDDALEELEPVRSFPAAAIAVPLVLLLAAGGAFALYRRASPAPAPSVPQVAETAAPAPVAAAPAAKPDPNAGTTLVQVASDPAGAEVRDEADQVVGTTPFELRVPSAKTVQLRFRRDGFRAATVKKMVEGERTALSVTLKRDKGAAAATQMGKRSVGYKDDPY
jgi:serine/threonine-protein kinase